MNARGSSSGSGASFYTTVSNEWGTPVGSRDGPRSTTIAQKRSDARPILSSPLSQRANDLSPTLSDSLAGSRSDPSSASGSPNHFVGVAQYTTLRIVTPDALSPDAAHFPTSAADPLHRANSNRSLHSGHPHFSPISSPPTYLFSSTPTASNPRSLSSSGSPSYSSLRSHPVSSGSLSARSRQSSSTVIRRKPLPEDALVLPHSPSSPPSSYATRLGSRRSRKTTTAATAHKSIPRVLLSTHITPLPDKDELQPPPSADSLYTGNPFGLSDQMPSRPLHSSTSASADADDTSAIRYALDTITSERNQADVRTSLLKPEQEQQPEEQERPSLAVESNQLRSAPHAAHSTFPSFAEYQPRQGYESVPQSADSQHPSPEEKTHQQAGSDLNRSSRYRRSTSVADIYVPYNDSNRSRAVFSGYLPSQLRTGPLACLALYTVAILVLLAVAGGKSITSGVSAGSTVTGGSLPGVADYISFGDGRYFAFRFLPTMLLTVNLVWLMVVDSAITRVAPFIALSSPSHTTRSRGLFLPLAATQFALSTRPFKLLGAGFKFLPLCLFVFWVQLFTVPLASSIFTVRRFRTVADATPVWRWVAVHGSIWTLFAMMVVQLAVVISLIIYCNRAAMVTGLRWDARSIADYIALYSRANSLAGYTGAETAANLNEIRSKLTDRTDRIGLWTTTKRPDTVFHGICEEGGPTRDSMLRVTTAVDYPVSVRRRTVSGLLRRSVLVVSTAVLAGLFAAFVGLSYADGEILRGFLPRVIARPNGANFSSANFLYSFVPTLVALLVVLWFQAMDLHLRQVYPFQELANGAKNYGATADRSILADYVHRSSLSGSVAALRNGHYLVAIVCLISTASLALPVVASGFLFALLHRPDSVRTTALRPAMYALSFFFALVLAGFCLVTAVVVARKGALSFGMPHGIDTLAEVTPWLSFSNLLRDQDYSAVASRAEMCNLFRDPASGGKYEVLPVSAHFRYAFGLYRGWDGREHLGVDSIARKGSNPAVFPMKSSHVDDEELTWMVVCDDTAAATERGGQASV